MAKELGIKPEEIVKKFTAILTQRGFKEVSTYEDMAGALLVLFIFGILLLLVSRTFPLVSLSRITYCFYQFCREEPTSLEIFTELARLGASVCTC